MPVLKMSVIGVIVSFALCAAAQEKQVKHVPIQRTSPASAKEMFMTYCVARSATAKMPRGMVPRPELSTSNRRT
jgi:hypothetical protein